MVTPREEPESLFKDFTQRSQIFILTKFGFNQILVNLGQVYDQPELLAFLLPFLLED